MTREAVIDAWRKAAEDLNIDVVAPFDWCGEGRHYQFIALVKGFGSSLGTLVADIVDEDDSSDIADASGCYWSAISRESYSNYDRDEFISMLNDWGWFGKESERPVWYSGDSWS